MIREEDGRAVIYCDSCPARMDLGNIVAWRAKLAGGREPRLPTGWRQLDGDSHQCSTHPATVIHR